MIEFDYNAALADPSPFSGWPKCPTCGGDTTFQGTLHGAPGSAKFACVASAHEECYVSAVIERVAVDGECAPNYLSRLKNGRCPVCRVTIDGDDGDEWNHHNCLPLGDRLLCEEVCEHCESSWEVNYLLGELITHA